LAVALLFFLHGARLSRDAVVAGITHWKPHASIFSATFILFPILGLALKPLLEPLITPELYMGILFLCCLPATVQSAIAFTSIARGNVPAAVCSASASSLLGIFITSLLISTVIVSAASAPISLDAVGKIMLQLLLPFVLGQLL
jgi:solute carrier family 10 (sodium/bile acid cotransporter), member 7